MSYYSHQADWREKIPCAFFYLGHYIPYISWIPMIWVIVANIKNIHLKDFVRYHCFQSILFNMISSFLPMLLSKLVGFIATLLSLLTIFENSANLLVQATDKLIYAYWLLIPLVIVYALIWTLRGRFTYLPPISQAVNLLLR